MKRLIVISMVLALVIASTTIAFAQTSNQVLIIPHLQDEITVTTEDELILASGWGACTRGLVKAWIINAHYQWYLDNASILSEEEISKYWGPIENRGAEPRCLVGKGDIWGSSWRYSIGHLPEGVYEITLTSKIDHPFIDGGDWDGDGHLDTFSGERTDTVTIYVQP